MNICICRHQPNHPAIAPPDDALFSPEKFASFVCVCVRARAVQYMHECMLMHACMRKHACMLCACMHAYMHACMHMCDCVRARVCVCVCVPRALGNRRNRRRNECGVRGVCRNHGQTANVYVCMSVCSCTHVRICVCNVYTDIYVANTMLNTSLPLPGLIYQYIYIQIYTYIYTDIYVANTMPNTSLPLPGLIYR